MISGLRIGIDLGGTKIEGAAIDHMGAIALRRRVRTPTENYRGTLDAVVSLVEGIEGTLGARGTVGIGIPGAIASQTGLVKNANSTWLIGRPLKRDVEDALGREVRFANDANCFALSEATDGAATACNPVFGVILAPGSAAVS